MRPNSRSISSCTTTISSGGTFQKRAACPTASPLTFMYVCGSSTAMSCAFPTSAFQRESDPSAAPSFRARRGRGGGSRCARCSRNPSRRRRSTRSRRSSSALRARNDSGGGRLRRLLFLLRHVDHRDGLVAAHLELNTGRHLHVLDVKRFGDLQGGDVDLDLLGDVARLA